MRWIDLERLRIYTGESDRYEHLPLYEHLVRRAHDAGLHGATVLRGMMGFGAGSVIHTPNILRLSEELPVIVEIVDQADRVDAFCEANADVLDKAFVTRDTVSVWPKSR